MQDQREPTVNPTVTLSSTVLGRFEEGLPSRYLCMPYIRDDGEMLTLDVSLRLSITYMSLSNLLSTVCPLLQLQLQLQFKTVINVGLCILRITASHIPKIIVGPLVWLALVWLSFKNNTQTGYNYRHRSAHGRITTDFFSF